MAIAIFYPHCSAQLSLLLLLKGMNVFHKASSSSNVTLQLWIGARFMECLLVLLVATFQRHLMEKHINLYLLMTFELLTTALLFLSIFVWEVFPQCYGPNGLTPFKKAYF